MDTPLVMALRAPSLRVQADGLFFALLFAALLAFASRAASADVETGPPAWLPPEAAISRAGNTPLVDGLCADGEWETASPLVLYPAPAALTEDQSVTTLTCRYAFFTHDGNNLYFCASLPAGKENCRARIWIDPEGKRLSARCFSIDAAGRLATGRVVFTTSPPPPSGATQQEEGVNAAPSWKGAVGRGPDGLPFVEAAIPLPGLAVETTGGATLLLNVAVDGDLFGEQARLPGEQWTWAPALGDPGFPGCFGSVLLAMAKPAARDFAVVLSPRAIHVKGLIQGLSRESGGCVARLELWRRGTRIAKRDKVFTSLDDAAQPFDLAAEKIDPGPAEFVFTLVQAPAGQLLSRSPVTLVDIPAPPADPGKILKQLSGEARSLEKVHAKVGASQEAVARFEADLADWRQKEALAQQAVRDLSAPVPAARPGVMKNLEGLRCDLAAMKARLKRVYVIPEPQSVQLMEGGFMLKAGTRLYYADTMAVETAARILQADIKSRFGVEMLVEKMPKEKRLVLMLAGPDAGSPPRLKLPGKSEGYRLRACDESVALAADDPAGLWNATRSLLQIMRRAAGNRIETPGVEIEDWPAFRVRAAAIDAAGLQRLTPAYLQLLVSNLSDLKYNVLLVNLANRFEFEKLGVGKGGLQADHLAGLCAYAASRNVVVTPIFDSFGRMNSVLSAGYATLRESPADPSTIAPLDPEAEKFLDNCVAEVSVAFPGGLFHFGGRGGEPVLWGGARPLSRDLVEREGAAGLLAWHFASLTELARRHGKIPCFWADSLMERPPALDRLDPASVLFVRPLCETDPRPPTLARAADAGLRTVATVELLESRLMLRSTRLDAIDALARSAQRGEAWGLCLSLIENSGAQFIENAWPALAYGADRCGNAQFPSRALFNEKLSWVWWETEAPEIVAAMIAPPAMAVVGENAKTAHENQAFLEDLTRMKPGDTWRRLNQMPDYPAIVAEARRVFGAAHDLQTKIDTLIASGRRNDPRLLHAQLLLRLHRHCATKILALDGAHAEYKAAIRSLPDPLLADPPQASPPKAKAPKSKSSKAGSPQAGSPQADPLKPRAPKAGSPKAGPPKADGQSGSSLPPEVIRHLAAVESHCRALIYDYPYLQEAFKSVHETDGLDPSAYAWVEASAADANAIYQFVARTLVQARAGQSPPPLPDGGLAQLASAQ